MRPAPEPVLEALAKLPRRACWLAGVSGGPDSMALAAALAEAGFRRVTLCHYDHGLRPADAPREASLVEAAAQRWGFSFMSGRGDAKACAHERRLSLEAAARALRLQFFEDCARRRRCWRLLLAHHLEDQAETVLMNLCRGAGMAGLGGIAPVSRIGRLEIHRPFLALRKNALLAFLQERQIAFAQDPTNRSPSHTRNRFRSLVLPAIQRAAGPAALDAISRAAEILREDHAWLDSLVPEPGKRLEVRPLRALPPAARRRLVLRWLRSQGVPEAGFEETQRVLSLLESLAPAKINLPGGWHARRRAGELFLEREAR